jgi:glycosyltransferase involved in cell wall biosynthesis
MSFSWIISQIGARQHYGVPRGFFYRSELRLLYTEAWCRWGHSLLARGNRPMRAFAGRRHMDIPNNLVVSFNDRVFTEQIANRKKLLTLEEQYVDYLRIGQWFASAVAKDLAPRELDPRKDVFFGFNTGCLETFALMKERGIPTICDQIDPASVEEDIVHQERLKWPGWQKDAGKIPEVYWQRMREEWSAANMILVNSQWSKDALIKQGVPAEKMFIVPVAYEAERTHLPSRSNFNGPFTVLWIGSVNLRKGIQYLIQAAKDLVDNPKIKILVAGPIQISDEAIASAPKNVEFVGRKTRDETEEMYRRADVFILPTVSDGFAITQVEAMSQALPVITTPNCGEVVTDGVDGLIVPPCDGHALAEAISKLEADRALLREMSYRALDKSAHFYLPRQSQLVAEAVTNYRAGKRFDQSQYKI